VGLILQNILHRLCAAEKHRPADVSKEYKEGKNSNMEEQASDGLKDGV